jgi:hypothetical protein
LEKLTKEISQQKEGEKTQDKQPLLKCMKTSNLGRTLSAMETITDEICDNDNWE